MRGLREVREGRGVRDVGVFEERERIEQVDDEVYIAIIKKRWRKAKSHGIVLVKNEHKQENMSCNQESTKKVKQDGSMWEYWRFKMDP
ncbi:hypothetical protein POSPLADRAFT_1038637 [Postia placenta MAD-698-R-SB12]|uniref:Uncharacterized protein n=1 Tax=Postia placenta MAD-698-R-SB12 TaxID=670580 RepID=A0A1X6ND29_9APHY|nr:hypothetical protein POSPLADRAFT_1038637 [Postia placenta MAD-698-R-SB12]OSX66484.1 hypothetical protein POSPLADRAFT_1038637 [Postia placenta MAD-698-R-SB12]